MNLIINNQAQFGYHIDTYYCKYSDEPLAETMTIKLI
jgi:hypothetical protein